MAKVKFDLKSLDIPSAAQKPLYAGVGVGDIAIAAVKDYVADVQNLLADAQKSVTDFDPKSLRKQATDAAAARVNELQKDAKALPTKVQTVVNDNVTTVTGTYAELAKRGEAVVRGTKLPSSVSAEVKVNPTRPAAKKATATKPAPKKPAAKKSTARKAAAKKGAVKTA